MNPAFLYLCAKCKQPATLNRAQLGGKKKGDKTSLGLGAWGCKRDGKGVAVNRVRARLDPVIDRDSGAYGDV